MTQMMATYPINAVRNMGTLLARTDLVVSLDLDFVVSREFSDVAHTRDMWVVRCGGCLRSQVSPHVGWAPGAAVTDVRKG
jgi:hypothetical protein